MEMKSFLRSLSVNLFNASTFACADLLENGGVLPKEYPVHYCLVNRVRTLIRKGDSASVPQNDLARRRKLEREFHKQFGKWPRGLKKVSLP